MHLMERLGTIMRTLVQQLAHRHTKTEDGIGESGCCHNCPPSSDDDPTKRLPPLSSGSSR